MGGTHVSIIMDFCVCWFQCSQPRQMFSLSPFPLLCHTYLPPTHFLTDTQKIQFTHSPTHTHIHNIKFSSLCNLQQLCYRSAAVIVLDIVSFVGSSCTEVLLSHRAFRVVLCVYLCNMCITFVGFFALLFHPSYFSLLSS